MSEMTSKLNCGNTSDTEDYIPDRYAAIYNHDSRRPVQFAMTLNDDSYTKRTPRFTLVTAQSYPVSSH